MSANRNSVLQKTGSFGCRQEISEIPWLIVEEGLMRKKDDLVVYPGTDRKPMKALQVWRDMRTSWKLEYQPGGPIHDQLKSPELIFGQP